MWISCSVSVIYAHPLGSVQNYSAINATDKGTAPLSTDVYYGVLSDDDIQTAIYNSQRRIHLKLLQPMQQQNYPHTLTYVALTLTCNCRLHRGRRQWRTGVVIIFRNRITGADKIVPVRWHALIQSTGETPLICTRMYSQFPAPRHNPSAPAESRLAPEEDDFLV